MANKITFRLADLMVDFKANLTAWNTRPTFIGYIKFIIGTSFLYKKISDHIDFKNYFIIATNLWLKMKFVTIDLSAEYEEKSGRLSPKH